MLLRVDSVSIRLVESRYFHQFGSGAVCLEVTHKECTIGTGNGGGGDGDGDNSSSSSSGSAIPHLDIPVALQRDANRLSQLVPVAAQHNYAFDISN
jgi:hypothetical protein